MRISVLAFLVGLGATLASSLEDVRNMAPRLAVRRERAEKGIKKGFHARDGAAHDYGVAAAVPAESYAAAPGHDSSKVQTDDNGYYYYYYPVEEEGNADAGELTKSNEEVLIGIAVAILVIVIIILATLWIPLGILPLAGGGSASLALFLQTLGIGRNLNSGVGTYSGIFHGRAAEAVSEYIPWETIDQLSTLVSNAIESDQCIERLACETGKYADGHTFLVSFLESFTPEGFKNSMKVFKDSALKKTDCSFTYFCSSLDESPASSSSKKDR